MWRPAHRGSKSHSPANAVPFELTRDDQALLEDLERRSFRFFWEQGDTPTGQVRDRARADGGSHPQSSIASISGDGIRADRTLHRSRTRVGDAGGDCRPCPRTTVRFLASAMPHERGWFYHFVNKETGAREWTCELSSIDTALLLAGVLTARRRFGDDPAIVRDATAIYERVDFPWMLNRHAHLLSMGWKPETGFLKARWATTAS